jgi:hypothetical protein
MWKFIFSHKKFQIAITVKAESIEDAHKQLEKKYKKLAKDGVDIPHPSYFELISQTHE